MYHLVSKLRYVNIQILQIHYLAHLYLLVKAFFYDSFVEFPVVLNASDVETHRFVVPKTILHRVLLPTGSFRTRSVTLLVNNISCLSRALPSLQRLGHTPR